MNGLNNRPFRHPVSKPRILPDFQAAMRTDVAERVGYPKPGHFSARFRSVLGCSLAAYRKSTSISVVSAKARDALKQP